MNFLMKAKPTDWLIGIVDKKYNHPGARRYTAFAPYLGLSFVNTPIKFRYFINPVLNKIEFFLCRPFSRSPSNWNAPHSIGLLIQEFCAYLVMLRSPLSVFHSVKGETDMHQLPRWSRLSNARLVVTFHDALDQYQIEGINSNFLRNFDGIVALCESQKGFLASCVEPSRVRVVHHGVDTSFFAPSVNPRIGAPTVISVGSYSRDHSVIAQAIRKVWEVLPTVKFVLLGLATMPQTMPEKIQDARVVYVDGVTDEQLLSLYHQSDVAAISVWAATANNALLEAMSCGLPVVATDIGGIPEYLGSNAGILVPPANPAAFAGGILEILSSPERAKKMGIEGRRRAVEMFDYGVTARAMQEFYDQVREWPKAPKAPSLN